MHIKRLALYSLLPLSLTLSGCVLVVDGEKNDETSSWSSSSDWEKRENENRRHIAQLTTGESLSEVLNLMGTPDFDEKLAMEDSEYRVLYYRTQRVAGDGVTSRDECTPLIFTDARLSGWGERKLKAIGGAF